MKAKQICETLKDTNIFDLIDEPTNAGVVVVTMLYGIALFMLILKGLKEKKERKGPFDGY